MNKRKAKERVLDLLSDKGAIRAPGRFHAHLMNELGLGSGTSAQVKTNVMTAVEELGRDNRIEIERNGRNILGIAPIRKRVPRDLGPEARRQSNFATTAEGHRLPSRLPDSLCSPVTIRYASDKSDDAVQAEVFAAITTPSEAIPVAEVPVKQEEVSTVDIDYKMGSDAHHTLTAALRVLRAEADETGQASVSIKMVLRCANLTESQADRVLDLLRALDLYSTQMTGFQESTYKVALTPEVITPEMVKQARSVLNRPATPKAETPTGAGDDTIDRLVDIVERLERELAAEKTKSEQLEDKLTKAREEVTAQKAANDELREQLASLQAQPTASKRVTDVLSRYQR